MKKRILILLLAGTLCGCAAKPVFETVSDDLVQSAAAQAQQVYVELPEELAVPVVGTEGKLYVCENYTLTMQTLPAGDLEGTLRQCTGFEKDALTVMATQREGVKRYDCAWSAAGEGQTQTCRLAILDDGSYHYTLCLMTDAEKAGDLEQTWQYILDSYRLESQRSVFSSGS